MWYIHTYIRNSMQADCRVPPLQPELTMICGRIHQEPNHSSMSVNVKTYAIYVKTSRTPEEGAHSASWTKGLIIIIIVHQELRITCPCAVGSHQYISNASELHHERSEQQHISNVSGELSLHVLWAHQQYISSIESPCAVGTSATHQHYKNQQNMRSIESPYAVLNRWSSRCRCARAARAGTRPTRRPSPATAARRRATCA